VSLVIYRRERDCVPPLLCKITTTTTGSPRPLERNVGPTERPREGRESHQLRLEINRRQMRRSPAGPRSRRVSDFSPPRSPPADNTTVFGKYKTLHDRLLYARAFSIRSSRLRAARGTESTPRKRKEKERGNTPINRSPWFVHLIRSIVAAGVVNRSSR
jgi:hypothetical protein